ncbi:MAG: thioredoxin domain-containing protein [Gammaproteobacteria bacterium]|nr:thioredoxin domain-containing protein [Gammaproteobacteria bacterium]
MSNALAKARSPYLRGHAGNPVDWREWNDEALDLARREHCPLFVSVGYSACHWCHVMAREAFSDAQVACLLNENFVSIKVDREERPDLDQVLQIAHQALNGRGGGWPLSVFLEPDGLTPFFAGTYFPLAPRYGMPGFAGLLERILAVYREQGEAVREQGGRLQQMLTERLGTDAASESALSDAPARAGHAALLSGFDAVHGGFGAAPKFPQSSSLAFLLSQADADAVRFSLEAMARGGLNDHVGGGFFRYTVDEAWRVPHFEKMLADNAQLLALYAEAAARFDSGEFRQTALATARFMDAELGLEDGGYASSLNAEARGREGGFYLWDRDEVRRVLGDERYADFAAAFGLAEAPQVEGLWHLALIDGDSRNFETDLTRLGKARTPRVRPERDDKCLTGLNALAVTALARAGLLLEVPELTRRAGEVFATLESTVVHGDEVLACALAGEAYQPGFLADYACLAEAALALASVREGEDEVALAVRLADAILARFRTDGGGLALTPAETETLLYRPRDYADNAVPSGAGTAVRVFIALGHLLAEPKYIDAAESVLRAAWTDMEHAPAAHPTLLIALDEFLHPPPFVVLRGDERIGEWAGCAARASPRARIVRLGPQKTLPELERYAPRGNAAAYACRGTSCSAPITDMGALSEAVR